MQPRLAPLRRSGEDRRAVGDRRGAFRIINHELHGPISLPASAENLQEDFSPGLNKDPATIVSAGRLRPAPSTGRNPCCFGIADLLVLVFAIVAAVTIRCRLPRAALPLAVPAARTMVAQIPAIEPKMIPRRACGAGDFH